MALRAFDLFAEKGDSALVSRYLSFINISPPGGGGGGAEERSVSPLFGGIVIFCRCPFVRVNFLWFIKIKSRVSSPS